MALHVKVQKETVFDFKSSFVFTEKNPVSHGSLWNRKRVLELTVLAVNSTEAWWTLADVTYEGVPPVGLTDLTCSSVVAWVWMARACVEKEREREKKNFQEV